MIEIIDGELYGMYSALEASLGHEPSKEELLAFEEKAEKALNALLADTKPETYVVLINPKNTSDARAFLENNEGRVFEGKNSSEIRDILNEELGDDACAVYNINEFMEEFNDTDDDCTCIDTEANFMGYVYSKQFHPISVNSLLYCATQTKDTA